MLLYDRKCIKISVAYNLFQTPVATGMPVWPELFTAFTQINPLASGRHCIELSRRSFVSHLILYSVLIDYSSATELPYN